MGFARSEQQRSAGLPALQFVGTSNCRARRSSASGSIVYQAGVNLRIPEGNGLPGDFAFAICSYRRAEYKWIGAEIVAVGAQAARQRE